MPPKPPTPTNSGIRKLSNGDSIIPSSLRPDGSVRKEIKVRPGYKPQEDVEVYKNRTAEGFRNRGKGGVPGANDVVGAEGEEKLPPHKLAVATGKNAKRREARRKAAAEGSANGAEDEGCKKINGESNNLEAVPEEPPVDPEAEAAKEARKLAKKLRQARELKEKKEQGGDLLPEQFAKVIRIQELIRQLDGLGFDEEGEKKKDEGVVDGGVKESAG